MTHCSFRTLHKTGRPSWCIPYMARARNVPVHRRHRPCRSPGRRKLGGSISVELSIDALRIAPSLDEVVLFAGDCDYGALVAALQGMGAGVTVVSTRETQPPMIADELRRQAGRFIDLADLEDDVGRNGG